MTSALWFIKLLLFLVNLGFCCWQLPKTPFNHRPAVLGATAFSSHSGVELAFAHCERFSLKCQPAICASDHMQEKTQRSLQARDQTAAG